jgi:hypothetical protein
MDPIETLTQVEALYRRILDLTRRQEACLKTGDLISLPPVLAEKVETLADAQRLTIRVQGAGSDRTSPAFQAALARVAAVLTEVVASEDRCRDLGPRDPPAPSRRQVVAAYSGSAGSGPSPGRDSERKSSRRQ